MCEECARFLRGANVVLKGRFVETIMESGMA